MSCSHGMHGSRCDKCLALRQLSPDRWHVEPPTDLAIRGPNGPIKVIAHPAVPTNAAGYFVVSDGVHPSLLGPPADQTDPAVIAATAEPLRAELAAARKRIAELEECQRNQAEIIRKHDEDPTTWEVYKRLAAHTETLEADNARLVEIGNRALEISEECRVTRNRLSDEAGRLATENRELLARIGELTLRLERAERKRGGR